MTFNDIVQEIGRLSIEQRKALIAILADSLAEPAKTRSLLELEGLGEHLWRDHDAQTYVDSLRQEWDDRS
jgi:hypothetical protein